MAILQRVNLLPNMRFDLPDARSIELFSQNDWRFFLAGAMSAKSVVLTGFDISNYSNVFSVPGVKVQISNLAVFHSEATTQAAGFYIAAGTEPDADLTLSSNAINFVEADFTIVSATPDTRALWDTGANAGAGGEYTDTVNTVSNLQVSISSNVSGFTSGKIPLYKITTNLSGVASTVQDCRNLFFRLGTGGTSPDPDHEYSWTAAPDAAHAQLETPISSTLYTPSNAPFMGGDKSIKTMKDWMDVVMTSIKRQGNLPYWYMKPQASAAQMYQNAALTRLVGGTFQHLTGTPGRLKLVGGSTVYRIGGTNCSISPFSSLDLTVNRCLYIMLPQEAVAVNYVMGQDGATPISPKRVSGVSSTSISVSTGGNYITGGGNVMVRGQVFSYTSYNAVTGAFLGVSPDPGQIVKNGDLVLQAKLNTVGYYHYSTSANAPSITSNNVSDGVENLYWVALYDGTGTIFFKDTELVAGEMVEIGNSISSQLLQYIGSTGDSDASPVYNVNTITNGTSLTAAIKAAFEVIERPIYDESIEYSSGVGVAANSLITLPLHSRMSGVAGAYTIGTGELQVYLDGVMWRVNKDYEEVSSTQIKTLKEIQPGSSLHFRIAAIGGAGSAAQTAANSLQGAYQNGAIITINSGSPVIIQGPDGETLFWAKGDLKVDGLIL